MGPFLKFSPFHPVENIKIIFNGSVSKRTFCSGFVGSSFLAGNLIRALIINIGKAFFYQLNSKFVKLSEIVRSKKLALLPVKA